MIHRHRGNRRYRTHTKAKRKERLLRETEGEYGYVKCFGILRKGKIHCSCPLCAQKTNSRLNRSRGPVQMEMKDGWTHPAPRGTRLSVTNGRYGKKNCTIAEKRSCDRMRLQMKEVWEE